VCELADCQSLHHALRLQRRRGAPVHSTVRKASVSAVSVPCQQTPTRLKRRPPGLG
jgi:hypothetical protein